VPAPPPSATAVGGSTADGDADADAVAGVVPADGSGLTTGSSPVPARLAGAAVDVDRRYAAVVGGDAADVDDRRTCAAVGAAADDVDDDARARRTRRRRCHDRRRRDGRGDAGRARCVVDGGAVFGVGQPDAAQGQGQGRRHAG